ncbi:hypothetical protein BJ875DRAFT_526816 [Amylocarpus encephaloides]|uniref:Uncharacterized protein n=1 Tax=Amylocarpus encephaloides TaxID=45428 RepID=A0A9P8C6X5_9HELO|nr:hypothetical protein BJ875DRAFT_526816 [Amylocarpus encephaloides]
MNQDKENEEEEPSSPGLMSVRDDLRNRILDTTCYGITFRRRYLFPKLQMCERDDKSFVAWISHALVPERSYVAWGIWFGEDFHENHHPNGSIHISEDEDAELLGEAIAAFGALSILEREAKEAKRREVPISHFIIVTACGKLIDFISGHSPLQGSSQLLRECSMLSYLVDRLEEKGINVRFYEDPLVEIGQGGIQAKIGAVRLLNSTNNASFGS